MPHTKHRTIAKLLRASGSVDIYFITHNFNAVTRIMWTRRVIGMTRVCLINKRQSSTTFYDENDVVFVPGFFYWFVSFGCLLWGVNFLHEKRQSLSRQYFITIWWFPEVLPPNHRLVFKAKSNVFLSWAIWYLKHQLHGKSLACLLNDSQSVYSNGWQIFVSRYTITVENYQGCIQSICKF